MATIGEFATKSTATIRDDYLRTIRNGLIRRGIVDPQVGPGSDYYVRATAIANELTPLYVNTQIKADSQMPDTATGDDLVRQMAIVGLAPRGASPSTGSITLDASATTTIPAGAQLIDAQSQRFEVLTPGVYDPGDLITIQATADSAGAASNHDAGDTLTWVAAPPYCNAKQIVATGGLDGGADAETEETSRARLLDRLQNPPGSGNWSQVNLEAEKSTPIVQKGFCYPAANGPGTLRAVVTGYPSKTSRSREVDATVMAGTVVPYLAGAFPEFVELVTTTVTDVEFDVMVALTLPASPKASPSGPGGGWIDGTPWPQILTTTVFPSGNVTAVSPGGGSFTVNADTPPTAGVSRICFFDPIVGELKRARIVSFTGSAGAYVVVVDQPFANLAAALALGGTPFVFPDATNMDTYVAAFMAATENMGPGELTSNVSVLSRAYRHPLTTNSWPSSVDSSLLRKVEVSGDEVTDTDYFYRSTTTPAVPGAVTDPPNQLIPRHVGFYVLI